MRWIKIVVFFSSLPMEIQFDIPFRLSPTQPNLNNMLSSLSNNNKKRKINGMKYLFAKIPKVGFSISSMTTLCQKLLNLFYKTS